MATARRLVPTPGIDHAEDDAGGQVGDRPGQCQAAGAHVERGDLVGQVDDRDVRRELVDDRLDHPDELVDRAASERNEIVS